MELNCSVSAQPGGGQNKACFGEPASRGGEQCRGHQEERGVNPFRRVLFVHERCGEFGGAEVNIQLAARELRRRGYLLGLLYAQGSGRNEEGWRQVFAQSFMLNPLDKTAAVEKALQHFEPNLIYVHHLEDLGVFEAVLRSHKPVVRMIHDHSLTCLRTYKYNYFTRRICQRPATWYCVFPCLGTIARNRHGVLPFQWTSYLRKQKEMRLTKRCDRLLVYSNHQKEELQRNGFDPAKIEICVPVRSTETPHGCSASGSENVLLYVGQIIRGKGVDVLLEALSKVKLPFFCNIVGTGNHQPYCERLSAQLGLENRVRFHGYVPPNRLEPFYLQARAFVMSSLWPEPFGMAGPEAMRYGLPVIAFDAGGIREWLNDAQNGFLVPWRDTDAFAARIDELLRSPELARKLGENGRESVKRYDAGGQITRLEQLFENLIQETRKQPQGFDLAPIGL